MESLQGYFLLATPQMPDPRFAQTVVFLCAHNAEGAMGLIVNQPLSRLSLADLFKEAGLAMPTRTLPPLYLGGPVEEEHVFFLYSAEYLIAPSLTVTPSLSLTRDPQILRDLAEGRGPHSFLPALGYAGWGAGQLEAELAVDGWLALPGCEQIIFHTPDEEKWHRAARAHGIDITLFGDVVGSA